MGKIQAKSIFRLVPLIGDLGQFLWAFTLKTEQYFFCTLDFCMFNVQRPAWFVCVVYSLQIYFVESCSATTELPKKRTKWPLI